jgi:hypothetical protein
MRQAAIILLTAAGVALLAADLSFEVATVRLVRAALQSAAANETHPWRFGRCSRS